MNCTSFETLSAYVDHSLPELEAATVEGHLQSCQSCRSTLDELRWLKDAVRSSAPAATASKDFEARLASAAAASRRRRRVARLGIAVAGGLTVALAALLVVLPVVRQRRALTELIGDHVGITVTREEAFDVAGSDAGKLEGWFAGKIDFPLHIPQVPAAKLVGARLCDIAGRHIPLASYELGTRRVSMFVERTGRSARRTVCDEQVHGYTVCRRTIDGLQYLFVSDYPANEAGSILTAALGPDTRP
jgi:anti-sigma factor RsiW